MNGQGIKMTATRAAAKLLMNLHNTDCFASATIITAEADFLESGDNSQLCELLKSTIDEMQTLLTKMTQDD